MNDTTKKINFFNKSQIFMKNYYKRILILLSILLAFFIIFQFYVFYTNNQILKTSIEFNFAHSCKFSQGFSRTYESNVRSKEFLWSFSYHGINQYQVK